MTKKQVIGTVAFLLVVSIVLCVLCDLFESKNTLNNDRRFYTYRNLAEDTVDTVFIGTSGIDRYWVSPKAYEEYGMTAYPLASNAFPSWLYINLIEETYHYQNPELLVIDIRPFTADKDDISRMDVRARRVLDSMDLFSWNRIKTAFTTMKWIHYADENEPRFNISYLLPFVKYHTMWKNDDYAFEDQIGSREHKYCGFYANKTRSIKIKSLKAQKYDSSLDYELEEICEQNLYELIDYIKENDLNVLFLDTPKYDNELVMGRTNRIYKILKENDMKYVHFYSEESDNGFSIDLDEKTDFYNEAHVNYYGAEKFTKELAEYISKNYDLPDRRNDEAAKKDWDGRYTKLKNKIKYYEENK